MSNVSPSLLGRLLEEISWEGNARHYREGGRGRENVLTAEVFQALDFLPRAAFLGRILESLLGGALDAVKVLSKEVEQLTFSFLPGDIFLDKTTEFCVQPDVVIESPSVYCLVEAKRIKPGAFQAEQLAREYLAVVQEAQDRGRQALLLLVLPENPPVAVSGYGRLEIREAIANSLTLVLLRCDHAFQPPEELLSDVSSVVAHTTWTALAQAIDAGLHEFSCGDRSVDASVLRVANAALTAIKWHGK
jgi:hypothetical protein